MSDLPVPSGDNSEHAKQPLSASRALAVIVVAKTNLVLLKINHSAKKIQIGYRYMRRRLYPAAQIILQYYRSISKMGQEKAQLLIGKIPNRHQVIFASAVFMRIAPRIIRKKTINCIAASRQFYKEWRQSLEKQDERAFMPAALEIIETAASPTGRKLLHFIMLIVTVFALWSWFGEVDIVAVAPGKIIPQGRTQVIQSSESGTVRQIAVRDGQRVAAGQILIELDDTALLAELSRSRQERIQMALDIARLQSILDPDQESQFFAGIDAPAEDLKRVLFHMKSQRLEHARKLAVIDDNLNQREAEREQAVISLEKINSILPLLEERASIRQKGAETQYGSRLLYLEIAQQLLELKSERIVQQQRLKASEAASQALISQKEQVTAEFTTTILNELNKTRIQFGQAQETEQKATRKLELTRIAAPINGTVQDLSLNTIGGVVSPAQQLLRIVPEGETLEALVVINNQDVGFVTAGQNAEIKTGKRRLADFFLAPLKQYDQEIFRER